MILKDTLTGRNYEAIIERLTGNDFEKLAQDQLGFDKFDWSAYKGCEVFKLRLALSDSILGLMCLKDHTDEATNAIEIELLEVRSDQMGSGKKFDNIGGCLIAFACQESFLRGHEGFVFLTPKTSLVSHYADKYGFQHIAVKTSGRPEGIMVLYEHSSRSLINFYLGY